MVRRMGGAVGAALVTVMLVAAAAGAQGRAGTYDPLALPDVRGRVFDETVRDERRDRDIPVRVYVPVVAGPAPVIVFSHGLGGSRENSRYLGEHWSARGYVCVFLQHAGSDESVWRDARPLQRMAAMRRAASAQNFLLRVADVPAVLDRLEVWNRTPGHALSGRLDLERVGMTGHSFGAVTTQAVSGQRFGRLGAASTDPRIDAALPMSPSIPRQGVTPEDAFGGVSIPWLLMTGTHDDSPIGDANPESRQRVFPALPPGSKYELVLDGAEHSAFSDRALPGDRNARNPNHHRVILALSTAFWDAYLKGDAAAKAWLDGAGARGVLGEGDGWRRK